MRLLVLTIVHHPLDARVHAREIRALLDAGHQVTYAAPWTATSTVPPDGVRAVDLPRAAGRHRLAAVREAHRLLRDESGNHDAVVVHDPELVPSLIRARWRVGVWDVHEDLQAAVGDKPWIPRALRRPVRRLVGGIERRAEARVHLILAEHGYADRFAHPHPVVANEPTVPSEVGAPGDDRVVYLGRLSVGRGVHEMVELAQLLGSEVALELLGWADQEVTPVLEASSRRGEVRWSGRIANDDALRAIEGATAGLSLLRDLPNYRHSRPTKVVEYMSRGVPVITTPSPVAVELVERHRCGYVVPWGDVAAVRDAVSELRADPELRTALGRNGHRAALEHHNWAVSGPRFVRLLEQWVEKDGPAGRAAR